MGGVRRRLAYGRPDHKAGQGGGDGAVVAAARAQARLHQVLQSLPYAKCNNPTLYIVSELGLFKGKVARDSFLCFTQ